MALMNMNMKKNMNIIPLVIVFAVFLLVGLAIGGLALSYDVFKNLIIGVIAGLALRIVFLLFGKGKSIFKKR